MVINMNHLVRFTEQLRNCGQVDYLFGLFFSVARQHGTKMMCVLRCCFNKLHVLDNLIMI